MRDDRFDIVVVGGANYDYLARCEALPVAGRTTDGDTFLEHPGGKGANQAVAAARLGARVAFVGRVGADARGEAVREALGREGVDTRLLVSDPEASTGVALVHVDAKGRKQSVAVLGANRRVSLGDVEKARGLLTHARAVLAQLEIPAASVEHAFRIAHDAGVLTVLDPAPPYLVKPSLSSIAHVIRPNSDEAQALTGVEVRDVDSAREAARALLAKGARLACVQAGKEGDLMVWEGHELLLRRHDVKSVDATGAGDSFAAALTVALGEGRSYEEAGRFASAASALATTRLGAMPSLPRRADVLQLVESAAR